MVSFSLYSGSHRDVDVSGSAQTPPAYHEREIVITFLLEWGQENMKCHDSIVVSSRWLNSQKANYS